MGASELVAVAEEVHVSIAGKEPVAVAGNPVAAVDTAVVVVEVAHTAAGVVGLGTVVLAGS